MHNLVFSILWGSRRSYCAFLLHFSFILVANTIYIASGLSLQNNGLIAIGFMLATLVVSWIAANYLYRLVELPLRHFKL
jgi:peptidoglycan/LPS O-acetylase OafA/YrhL